MRKVFKELAFEHYAYHSRRKTPHFNAGDVRRNS